MCVCLVFQLRHILFLAIKINIHVAIFIQYTKHALMYIYIYIYIKTNVCVCLVFQLRHILFPIIKIIIHVAILVQCTKHILSHWWKEILKTRKMNSSMNTSPISNEKERERERERERRQMEYHVWTHIQWKWRKVKWISNMSNGNSWARKCSQILTSNIYNPSVRASTAVELNF